MQTVAESPIEVKPPTGLSIGEYERVESAVRAQAIEDSREFDVFGRVDPGHLAKCAIAMAASGQRMEGVTALSEIQRAQLFWYYLETFVDHRPKVRV